MKQPKTYTAPHAVYTGGEYYPAGTPFTTAEEKGAAWQESDPRTRAAAAAADPRGHADVDLTKLDVAALKAHAAAQGIDVGPAKKAEDILAVIRAADEPKL